MPIYAYKCSSCGHADDVLQKMTADPLTVCPACGKATYSKQVTAPQFQLKGSGWYVTDFRGGNGAGGAKDGAAKVDAKSESSGESKPDSKSESKNGFGRSLPGAFRSIIFARSSSYPRRAGHHQKRMTEVRKYLIAGLLVWIPLVITGWVLKLLIDLMDQSLLLLPERFHTEAWLGFHVPGMGVFLTVFIVLATGVIAANFFGKQLLSWWDRVLQRIPIVRSIYGGVKQISDTLFSPEGKAFRKAVLVRYPQHDTWTVALLTGVPQNEVTDHLGHDNYSVFVPTTPNITAGFFLIVPKAEVRELEMSVDEALKYIISMGVAEPARPLRLDPPHHHNGAEMKKSGTDPNP